MLDNRIYTYYNEAVSLLKGNIINPRMAIIYPVYGCDLNCMGCLCSDMNSKRINMDFLKFKTLGVELKSNGIKSIELSGGGEPLLHPDIYEIIPFITNELRVSLGILTNGMHLDNKLCELIVKNAKYIRVSIYEHTFGDVFKNISNMINLKTQFKSLIRIGAKILVTKNNLNKIMIWCHELLKIGVDLISIKSIRNSSQEITELQRINLEKEIDSIGDSTINLSLRKSMLKGSCWLSPIHTLIDPYGDMYICCYYAGRKDDHKIGNVFDNNFEHLWGSIQHKCKIEKIDPHKCNIYDCRWHFYNKEMKDFLTGNKVQHEFC